MEKRKLNVMFYKAGNGKGSRISLPITWLRQLDINEDKKEVDIELDLKNKSIIIKKHL